MRNPLGFILFFAFVMFVIDLYTFRGLKKLILNYKPRTKKIIKIVFWSIPIIFTTLIAIFLFLNKQIAPRDYLKYFHFLMGGFSLLYFPKLFFLIFNFLDDLILFVKWLIKKFRKPEVKKPEEGEVISRGQFLTKIGIITAGIPFLSIAYGINWGRFDFTVRNLKASFPNLPKAFHGLKLVQISDFHLGSFLKHDDKVEEIVDMVNKQNPDILVFTGDFVNNVSTEVDPFLSILKRLKAKMGVYSILGNHDYGEYVPWKSEESRKNNLDRLINLQREIGFNLLLNESTTITKDDESIEMIGVENWGKPPFPQYGDVKKAMSNVSSSSFKIMLSHDPTHWDEQILQMTDVDLTLSGHTHGAQFGIEIPGWRWSPVNLRYKRWGGMYNEGNQYLHVNTGLGFLGFPARIGMPPEITVIELQSEMV